ncbi:MAG: histidine phosphatase family protein [Chloroflexota bacterium]
MILLWLVRHGQTDWNKEKRYQGHSDILLNEVGQAQAEKVAHRLRDERVHAIISSDLQRATQTADAIVAHHLRLTVQTNANLREANFGMFEGLRYKDIIDNHKQMAEMWFDDPEAPPQGGEKLSEVFARVQTVRQQIEADYPRKRLVLVGHDGALRLLLCDLLGLPATQYWRFNFDSCSLSQVNIYPGGAILVRLNDISHLGGDA